MNVSLKRSFRSVGHTIIAAALCHAVHAEDEKIPELITSSGKTYQNVSISKVTPSEVSITHESGAARIPFSDLPEDLRAKLGYDPAKAEAHKQAVAKVVAEAQRKSAETAQNAAILKKASSLSAHVLRVHQDEGFVTVEAKQPDYGIVASSSQSNGGGGGYYAPSGAQPPSKPKHTSIYGSYVITNVPDLSKIADGERVNWLVAPTDKTLKVGGMTTYKVCQYVGPDK